LRVARRISRISFSAGIRVGRVEDFWLIFTLLGVTMSQKSPLLKSPVWSYRRWRRTRPRVKPKLARRPESEPWNGDKYAS
jgi:hypothetical protein